MNETTRFESKKCEICGQTMEFSHTNIHGEDIYICQRCGLIEND